MYVVELSHLILAVQGSTPLTGLTISIAGMSPATISTIPLTIRETGGASTASVGDPTGALNGTTAGLVQTQSVSHSGVVANDDIEFVVCMSVPYKADLFGAKNNLTLSVSSTIGATTAAYQLNQTISQSTLQVK